MVLHNDYFKLGLDDEIQLRFPAFLKIWEPRTQPKPSRDDLGSPFRYNPLRLMKLLKSVIVAFSFCMALGLFIEKVIVEPEQSLTNSDVG